MNAKNWSNLWSKVIAACEAKGGTATELQISPPAAEPELLEVESVLQIRLPEHFRTVLLDYTASVEFNWFLPAAGIIMPEEFAAIFSGGCYWDLRRIIEIEETRRSWIDNCFANPEDDYDKVWHDKLAFFDIPNGDMLALDLSAPENPAVIYLSHDDGELHGCRLGDNFIDFVGRWTFLGCPGPEEWQLKPFVSSPVNGSETSGDGARKWRRFLGL